ncbi:hypothetical protein GCK72_020373 [Caenorhabditis remanei]|uniref:BTB domain-containing protein n=1 Tax=Caenorhabditis remanei TaxID=31234 RepID=A0A6A5GGI4_CAERE|nr:hypothetical protein GCK72_020373 [Caenorhabditis remanei]KAF1753816.1 hypothetical protein GCK72_020373 [Caenorhabditis remanei]
MEEQNDVVMEGDVEESSPSSANVILIQKQIAEEEVKLEQLLQKQPLATPRIIQKIVMLTLLHNLNMELCQKSVRTLAEFWKNASIYKKRRMAQQIARLNLTTKTMFIRELRALEVKSYPLDVLLSKASRNGLVRDGTMKFQKPNSDYHTAMVIGNNIYGRLGVSETTHDVEDWTPVNLPDAIKSIHIGINHTIFILKNGDLYGCGKMSNFMEGMAGSTECSLRPIKLGFYTPDRGIRVDIVVENDYTEIFDTKLLTSLIIGNPPILEFKEGEIRSSGPNWVHCKRRKWQEEGETVSKEIEVDVHDGTKRKVKILNDCCHWVGKNEEKHKIVCLIDGFRLDIEQLKGGCLAITDTKMFANVDKIIYSGKLIMVPRERAAVEDNINDEDEDYVDEEDMLIAENETILLALLEEIVSPYSFDDFEVSVDGEAFIGWSIPPKPPRLNPEPVYPLAKQFPYESYEAFDFLELSNPKQMVNFDGYYLLNSFKKICRSVDMKALSVMYAKCGIPKTTSFVRGLLALIHFLRPDEATGLPEVLVKNVRPDKNLDGEAVKREMMKSMNEGSKIPVLVVKADLSIIEKKKRKEQMEKKSRDYLLTLMKTVESLLEKFNTLPLKYRMNRLENNFGSYINKILRSLNDPPFFDSDAGKRFIRPPLKFTRSPCKDALWKRLKNGDITGKEERVNLVRVEAVAFLGGCRLSQGILSGDPTIGYHHVYWVHTTRFHIECIAPSLLTQIDEESGVINLNTVCHNDTSPDRFQKLLDSFFLIQHDGLYLNYSDRTIDVNQVTESLPPNETYTIKTSDGVNMKVPKVLFELFSEFDAARRRHENVSNESDTFELKDYSSTTISMFLNCLVDIRMCYKESMESKMEIYKLAEFTLATLLRDELLYIIVLTAEEKDYEHLKFLTFERRDEMISLIAEHRPDIVLFWKNLPVDQNPLGFINTIINKTASTRYQKIENEDDDVQIIEPMTAKEEIICPEYLLHHLCNNQQDQDVMVEFMKTIFSWNEGTSNPRKRVSENRYAFVPIVL